MTAIFSLEGTVLGILTVTSFSVFCLWCRRKTKIIHEENQIYDPQTFRREGSRFAVMRSKTVTRPNQIIRDLPATPVEQKPEELNAEQHNYQNIAKAQMSRFEPTYVHPIPAYVYQNVDESINEKTVNSETDTDQPYENVFPSSVEIITNSDENSDYENSEFLEQEKIESEDSDPDYVNDTA
ncbi:hypothetical protein DPEC_G00224020 [Dallia pectoralis]|uniref:Uncharacterized protein n=1 Tax=Dallia pectoralis TaxID=75939 RepID=A0ACC2G039_DALPE|nr:hypothetical protein DPEC_G00224020 [Dallia pectoralis]